MAKADKATAVDDIAERFKEATATVVTEYRGLSVANLAELRRSLGDTTTYTVAKNTLVKRAASEAGVQGLDELFVGPTAIAFIQGEPVDAAKAIKTFAKDHKALVIKGGYMDGQALTVAQVEQIADLESREVLLAKLAGAMKANLSKAAVALQRRADSGRPPVCSAAGKERCRRPCRFRRSGRGCGSGGGSGRSTRRGSGRGRGSSRGRGSRRRRGRITHTTTHQDNK